MHKKTITKKAHNLNEKIEEVQPIFFKPEITILYNY